MMKLSQLLKLKQDLMQIDLSRVTNDARLLRVNTNAINMLEYDRKTIDQTIDGIVSAVKSVSNERDRMVKAVDSDIARLKSQYLEESERLAQAHILSDIKLNREVRVMHYNPGVEDAITARIGQYVSWETPGLEIGPGDGYWTKHLVAQDPLYLADIHAEFLNSTIRSFSGPYQNRLRPYVVKNFALRELPRSQMGFVFSWNVFNYLSMSMIEHYLSEIKLTMRPGGIMMFSYNNCELYKSVEMFENNFMTFVPASDLIAIIKKLGFELVASKDIDTHISWLEIRNPGKLETNRAGQTLGKIIDKSA